MENARDVVQEDLRYICQRIETELARMAGKRLLITGGASFLGYYLIQAILHWNNDADEGRRAMWAW